MTEQGQQQEQQQQPTDAAQKPQTDAASGKQPDAGADAKKEADSLLFNKEEKKEGEQGKDGEKKDGEKSDKKDDAKKDAPPEFKLEELKIPETMPLAEDMKEEIVTFAKDNKLTKEAMQKGVDMVVKVQEKHEQNWKEMKKGWREEVKADAKLGGSEENLKKTIGVCDDVVRKFGGSEKELEELQDDLILLGLGNKRSFIRFLVNVHNATKEDKQEGTGGSGEQQKDIARTLWPNMPGDKK